MTMATKTSIRSPAQTLGPKGVGEKLEEEGRVFDAFLKHQRTALMEAGKALEAFLPDSVREHGEAAFKEAVEGYRELVNTTIDEIVEVFERAKVGEKPDGTAKEDVKPAKPEMAQ